VVNLVAFAGASRLRSLAGGSSEMDRFALTFVNTASLNTALVVLFLGAITAMISFGRTLRPAESAGDEPASPDDQPASPDDQPASPGAEPDAVVAGPGAVAAGPGERAEPAQTS
jgi:hypothetical protein